MITIQYDLNELRKEVDEAIEEEVDRFYTGLDDDGFLELACYVIPIKDESVIIYKDNKEWNVECRNYINNKIEVTQYHILPESEAHRVVEIDEDMQDRKKYMKDLKKKNFLPESKGREDEAEFDSDLFDPKDAVENLPDDFMEDVKDDDGESNSHSVKENYISERELRSDIFRALEEEEPDKKFNEFRDDSFLLD